MINSLAQVQIISNKNSPISIKMGIQILVWMVNFGRADWRGMLQSVNKREYVRYVTYLAEKSMVEMRNNSANTTNPVTYQTFIIDMEELSMHQMSYKPCKFSGLYISIEWIVMVLIDPKSGIRALN